MTDLAPGAKPEEALKAFQTISAELDKVRPLNYRSPLFTNWKKIVQVALTRFLGEEHPTTLAFTGLTFHGPMPKSPMDPPVSQKDIDAYASAMEATTALINELIGGLSPTPAPAVAPATPAIPEPTPLSQPAPVRTAIPGMFSSPPPPPPVEADSGFRVTRGTSSTLMQFPEGAGPTHSQPPAASAGAAHDLPRHSGGIPEGGLKIVSRSGVQSATTLDQYLSNVTDDIEREIVTSLRDAMNDPDCRWETIKHYLAELWWQKKESIQKILPIILRR